MRIIFSRKGFDSAAGGGPSPIVEGRPVSLPIPAFGKLSCTTYGDLRLGEHVALASRRRVSENSLCHHDPMFLDEGRCVFGQCGAALTHLRNQGVGVGDVFLFFGWFAGEGWPDHHRIFGYLRVEEVVRLVEAPASVRQHYLSLGHPHAIGMHSTDDTLFVGEGRTASTASPALCLTALGRSRRYWHVPDWLRTTGLTYHDQERSWPEPELLVSAAQGQEFVADIGENDEAHEWLNATIAEISRS